MTCLEYNLLNEAVVNSFPEFAAHLLPCYWKWYNVLSLSIILNDRFVNARQITEDRRVYSGVTWISFLLIHALYSLDI